MIDADKIINLQHLMRAIKQTSETGLIGKLIRKSGFESRITFGWDFGLGGGLRSPSTSV